MIESVLVIGVVLLAGYVAYKVVTREDKSGTGSSGGTPANKNEADIDKH